MLARNAALMSKRNILYAAHLHQPKVVMLNLKWGISPLWVLYCTLQWMHFPFNT